MIKKYVKLNRDGSLGFVSLDVREVESHETSAGVLTEVSLEVGTSILLVRMKSGETHHIVTHADLFSEDVARSKKNLILG
jgi:hypothetical protein